MRLYFRPIAPNALKVLVFLAERGLTLDLIDVATLSANEYSRVSPLGMVPVLETDKGLLISESLTICQYLDAVTPGRQLFGEGPDERAMIGMWERRAELLLMNPAIEYGHHTHPMFEGRLRQFPDWARAHVAQSEGMIVLMESRLSETRFLAGDRVTSADLTAFLGYSGLVAYSAVERRPGPALARWTAEIGARPSMAPFHALAAQMNLTP